MGSLQEKQGVICLPASCPSQAIVDVSENMRAKIYALFCKIGTNLQDERYTEVPSCKATLMRGYPSSRANLWELA